MKLVILLLPKTKMAVLLLLPMTKMALLLLPNMKTNGLSKISVLSVLIFYKHSNFEKKFKVKFVFKFKFKFPAVLQKKSPAPGTFSV